MNQLYALLRHARFIDELPSPEDCSAYLFETPDSTPVVVAWCHALAVDRRELPGPSLHLPAGHGLRVLDMMGNPLPNAGDQTSFQLSSQPVYFVAAGSSTADLRRLFREQPDDSIRR